MRYLGVLGSRWFCSVGRESAKALGEDEVNGRAGSGVRDSPVIVMGRAKREDVDVNLLKASRRSCEAGGVG